MGVLFLDPLTLGLLLVVIVHAWLVWRGVFRRWFGRPDAWTVVAWPLPLVMLAVPAAAGPLLWLAGSLGLDVGTGGITGAVVYGVVLLAPAALLTVWPPGWLLPGWARDRVVELPAVGSGPEAPPGAMPAIQGLRGHGSLSPWVWRVDGIPGHVWVDGAQLRFRPATRPVPAATTELHIDEGTLADLRWAADGGEVRLEAPRGGWWSRGHLDVDVGAVDRIRFPSTVPWRRAGPIVFEVEGRRPAQLWVADVRRLRPPLLDGSGTPRDTDVEEQPLGPDTDPEDGLQDP